MSRNQLVPWVVNAAVSVSLVSHALAADKNGVSPQVISLPSGPGSIHGLGESFQPQLNTGAATFTVPITVPPGSAGRAPKITLQYNSGFGNGPMGIGWMLAGPTSVSRNLDLGVPLYVDAPNGFDDDADGVVDNIEEIDRFTGVDGEELIPVAGGYFRAENESGFIRYSRDGTGWEGRAKNGERLEFGRFATGRIESMGLDFRWCLERATDTNGNAIEYRYLQDAGSHNQKYLREVRWGAAKAFFAVVLFYSNDRPDIFSDFRSGFEIRTGLRLIRIDVISQGLPAHEASLLGDANGDGTTDALIRRYRLTYTPDSLISTLAQITLVGADGVSELPSLSFEYTPWVAPDLGSLPLIYGSNDPVGIGLSSGSVELADLNNDGLPDLLSTIGGSHYAYLNEGVNVQGLLAWSDATSIGNAPSLDLTFPSIHLADVNADGLADLAHKSSPNSFEYYANLGTTAWDASAIPLSATDSWPIWPFDGVSGAASRVLDADHNRLSDVLFTDEFGYQLWMLLPGGKYALEQQVPPLVYSGQTFRFDLPGTHVADLNGDRLSDLVWVRDSEIVYWPNAGRGLFATPVVTSLGTTLSSAEIGRAGFADINGDGISDLTIIRPEALPDAIHYWVNLGLAGFDFRRTVDGLPVSEVGEAIRWADMNGNGSADIIISNASAPPGSTELVLDLLPGTRPNLLSRITNGMGLEVTIEYSTSVGQMVAATATSPWTSTAPASVPVVSMITESDGRSPAFVRELTYRDPYFDPVKQEFRGFSEVKLREIGDASAPTRVLRHAFETGRSIECLKGKESARDVLSETGLPVVELDHVWSRRVVGSGSGGEEISFAVCESTDTLIYEGTVVPIRLRTVKDYDDFGNMTEEHNLGITDGVDPSLGDDEVLTQTEFVNGESLWIVDRPSRKEIRNLSGQLQAETRFFYDGLPLQQVTQGNLTRKEEWLNTENRYIPVQTITYDTFGNPVSFADANNHLRTVQYDGILHAFPVVESIHLEASSLNMAAAYEFGFGTINSSTDFAGAVTNYTYDVFGRMVRLVRPGDAVEDFTFALTDPISSIRRQVREDDQGNSYDTYMYFDGYGRKLGFKVEGENGQWRYIDAVEFNSRKLEHRKWLPYYTNSSLFEAPNPIESLRITEYDARDRVTRIENPDGSSFRTVYEPLTRHVWDENDNAGSATPTTYRSDGRDLLAEVTERNGSETYVTTYEWNTLANLTLIVDSQQNVRTYSYDSLKRMTGLNDPNRGGISNVFDDVGNLICSTDAKQQSIEYAYDHANRLITENYLDQGGGIGDSIDVEYFFDAPSEDVDFGDGTMATAEYTGGRLASVIDRSGGEHFSYDARGNIVWTVKRIRDPQLNVEIPFATQYDFDRLNRVKSIVYPDNDRIEYEYNNASLIERISGGPSGRVIVPLLNYGADGQLSEMHYGDGSETSYSYDVRDRLSLRRTISTSGTDLVHFGYSYDSASNITRIDDLRPFVEVPADSPRRNTQLFQYDDLYRLTRVRYSPVSDDDPLLGEINYSYDALGNMLTQQTPASGSPGHIDDPLVNLGTLAYAGGRFGRIGRQPGDPPGPHALTSTTSGTAISYDDNGNMTALDGASLTWDFKDRLTGYEKGVTHAEYEYDYSDRRVSKWISTSADEDRTLYVNKYFEIRPGLAPTKYVFNGDSRIAQVKGTLDSSRPRVQRFWLHPGWNLIGSAVNSSQTVAEVFGVDVEMHAWLGDAFVSVGEGASLPWRTPFWVNVPTARVASAIGAYVEDSGSIPLPWGSALVAWPRLEPFILGQHTSGVSAAEEYNSLEMQWRVIGLGLPAFVSGFAESVHCGAAFCLTEVSAGYLTPNVTSDEDIEFLHLDHLQTITSVTSLPGATISERAHYPFGLARHTQQFGGFPGLGSFFSFASKERDIESNLDYFEARYYSSALARFLSTDPALIALPAVVSRSESNTTTAMLRQWLGNPQRNSTYSYCLANPMNRTDPSGQWIFGFFGIEGPDGTKLYGNYTGPGNNAGTEPINIVDATSAWHDERFEAPGGFFSADFWSKPSNLLADLGDLAMNIAIIPRVIFYDSWSAGYDDFPGEVVLMNAFKIAWYSVKIPLEVVGVTVRAVVEGIGSLFD